MTKNRGATVVSRWALLVLAMSCLYCRNTMAQAPTPPAACSQTMLDIAGGATAKDSFSDLALHGGAVVCFWELALPKMPLSLALRTQAALSKGAATVQAGAPSGSNGTTSAISKPNTPLALATEYGGITSSTSNQTMTLQTSLDGIPAALGNKGLVPYCWSPVIRIPGCVESGTLQALSRIGVGITSNTAGSSQNLKGTAAPAQGTAQQASLTSAGAAGLSLASIFAKFTILPGKYEPTTPTTTLSGEQVIQARNHIINALREFTNVYDESDPSKPYQRWKSCIETRFTKEALQTPEARKELFAKYWAQIAGILLGSTHSVDCSASAPIIQSNDIPNPTSDRVTGKNVVKLPGTPPTASPTELTKAQNDLVDAINEYLAAISIFNSQADQLIRKAASALSLEYDFNTPTNQPTTSTIKLVGSKGFGHKVCGNKTTTDKNGKDKADISSKGSVGINRLTETINIGGNFYNSAPSNVPGSGTFRDLQAGTETDIALCTSSTKFIGSFLGNSTLGLTYYYQDQKSPSILKVTPGMPLPGITITGLASTTSTVFATKGPINFVQLKYGLGTGKNVKFPIAVSWSNRTDLITHSLWSAQFGVSYDFSSLFNSSGTSKSGDASGSN
jgi:hypothetical protein